MDLGLGLGPSRICHQAKGPIVSSRNGPHQVHQAGLSYSARYVDPFVLKQASRVGRDLEACSKEHACKNSWPVWRIRNPRDSGF